MIGHRAARKKGHLHLADQFTESPPLNEVRQPYSFDLETKRLGTEMIRFTETAEGVDIFVRNRNQIGQGIVANS